jgi:hypothetical protein
MNSSLIVLITFIVVMGIFLYKELNKELTEKESETSTIS